VQSRCVVSQWACVQPRCACWSCDQNGALAAGILPAPVGAEGGVARSKTRRRVVDGKLNQWHKFRPVITALAGSRGAAQDISDQANNKINLTRHFVTEWCCVHFEKNASISFSSSRQLKTKNASLAPSHISLNLENQKIFN
jgi:hypothetical protein